MTEFGKYYMKSVFQHFQDRQKKAIESKELTKEEKADLSDINLFLMQVMTSEEELYNAKKVLLEDWRKKQIEKNKQKEK